jgi:lipopolysaccharide/colanic/teichoic acid biosynthesis glycosyltransferase
MIVLTGASGFVGSQLVRRLRQTAPLLLVSRDPATLPKDGNIDVCSYDALQDRDLSGAVVIHLAVRNNDRPGDAEEFHAANVTLLLQTAKTAKDRGAARFINLCSTRALHPKAGDFYGISKREGAERLAAYWPEGTVNLYLPAIYGDAFQGRLAPLNYIPAFARPLAIGLLRLVKPVISIDNLISKLREIAFAPADDVDRRQGEQYAANAFPKYGIFSLIKRSIDLLAVLAVLIFVGWAMVCIAIYIRLDSKGPAIFTQKRVGRHGRIFTCYKFRTMAVGTAHAATHEISSTVVTRAGRFLRRTKLDELPQILNVLLNQMSLVGPRPCLPSQIDLIERRANRGVLDLKPGVTGLPQVNGVDMSDPSRLAAWDARYGALRALPLEAMILIRTVLGGGSGDRVSRSAH